MKKTPKKSNLLRWLSDPRSDEFFWPGFDFKFEILKHVLTGRGTLSEIALRHGVSKQAASKMAITARRIYEIGDNRRLTTKPFQKYEN